MGMRCGAWSKKPVFDLILVTSEFYLCSVARSMRKFVQFSIFNNSFATFIKIGSSPSLPKLLLRTASKSSVRSLLEGFAWSCSRC